MITLQNPFPTQVGMQSQHKAPVKCLSNVGGEVIRKCGDNWFVANLHKGTKSCANNEIVLFDKTGVSQRSISQRKIQDNNAFKLVSILTDSQQLVSGGNSIPHPSESLLAAWDINTLSSIALYPVEDRLFSFDMDKTHIVGGFDCRSFRLGTYSNKILNLIDRVQAKTTSSFIYKSSFGTVRSIAFKIDKMLNTFNSHVLLWDINCKSDNPIIDIDFGKEYETNAIRWKNDQQAIVSYGPHLFRLDLRKNNSPQILIGTEPDLNIIHDFKITNENTIISNSKSGNTLCAWDEESNTLINSWPYLDENNLDQTYYPSNLVAEENSVFVSDHQDFDYPLLKQYNLENTSSIPK